MNAKTLMTMMAASALLAALGACGSKSGDTSSSASSTTGSGTSSASSTSGSTSGSSTTTSGAGGGTGAGGGAGSTSSTSTSSSSGAGGGGCNTFTTQTYTFTLAPAYDWSSLQVSVQAAGIMSDSTEGASMTAQLGATTMSWSFMEYGCTPAVDVQLITYANVPNASFSTECQAGPTTVKEANIIIQPPTNLSQDPCTAPPIQ